MIWLCLGIKEKSFCGTLSVVYRFVFWFASARSVRFDKNTRYTYTHRVKWRGTRFSTKNNRQWRCLNKTFSRREFVLRNGGYYVSVSTFSFQISSRQLAFVVLPSTICFESLARFFTIQTYESNYLDFYIEPIWRPYYFVLTRTRPLKFCVRTIRHVLSLYTLPFVPTCTLILRFRVPFASNLPATFFPILLNIIGYYYYRSMFTKNISVRLYVTFVYKRVHRSKTTSHKECIINI